MSVRDNLDRAKIENIQEELFENLLPYPFSNTTREINGISYTDNGDGSITINGQATADSIFMLSPVFLKAGTYTLGVYDSGFNSNLCNLQFSNSENNLWWGLKDVDNSTGFNTYTLDRDLLFNYNRLIVKKGHTMDNVTWKPIIVSGKKLPRNYKSYSQSKISKGDVVDNLLSDSSNLPLSAKQGKLLDAKFGGLSFVKMSKSAYDALATKDENTIYFTYEE